MFATSIFSSTHPNFIIIVLPMLHCRLPGNEKFRYNKNSSSRKHFLYQSVTREKERLFESFLNRLTVFATIQVPSFEIDDMTRADWKLGRVWITCYYLATGEVYSQQGRYIWLQISFLSVEDYTNLYGYATEFTNNRHLMIMM